MSEQIERCLVGTRARPIDWVERTAGGVPYTGDLDLDDVLHVAIVRSPLAHARLHRIDLTRSRRTPGFVAALTADDFAPDACYLHRGPPLSDRPPLAREVVRFVGQEVCAVAATSRAAARAAADAVRLELTELPAPLTTAAARTPGAPTLHVRATAEPNVAVHFATDWGDVEAARAASVVEHAGTYRYPSVSHAVMEPNILLAQWDDEASRLEVWTSTQAPFFVVKELANLLELPAESIVLREVAVGGGFGAKSKCAEHEVIAAALARKTRRRTLVELTREEEFALTKPRHAFTSNVRVGLDADGRVALVEGAIDADNGAYNHMGASVMRVGAITLGSLYRPIGVRVDARLVDTATQPGGQYRGYGTPQVALAMESELDEAAARAGHDPLDVRIRSANLPDTETLCGYKVTTTELVACLDAVREHLGWDAKRPHGGSGRGVGVAAAMHGSGAFAYPQANESEARVELDDDGIVHVYFGGADAGTGQRTILAQLAAEALGVGLDQVEVVSMDGELTPLDLGAWSSRATHMSGHAVGLAAAAVRARVVDLAAAKLGSDQITLRDGDAVSPNGTVSLGDLVRLDDGAADTISETAHYLLDSTEPLAPGKTTANLSPTYCFAAHGAEVEVDERTGRVRLVDYVAAHDVGRALNPTLVDGQIVGGAVMGIGAALGEELIRTHGRVVNAAYINYALPRAGDVPAITPVIVEGYDAEGPQGAKSVGEIPIIPPPPAIGNAIAHACGIRLRDAPFTPDKVLTALAERDGRHRRLRWRRRPSALYIAAMRAAYPRGLHALLHHVGTRFARRVRPRPVEELAQPATIAGVIAELGRDGDHLIAGGTDLLLQQRQRLVAPRRLISVTAVDALAGIRVEPDGSLWIGAATTLHDLLESTLTPPVVAQAVATIATPQVRAVATVAGNLLQAKRCWFFRNGFDCYKRGGVSCPCYAVLGDHRFQHAAIDGHRCQAVTPSDLATVLVALDAEITITGARGTRTVTAAGLYTGPGETVVGDRELVECVRIPAAGRRRLGAFQKLGLYDGDFAAASVALTGVAAADGTFDDLRIVLGAMAPVPWRATATERQLAGRPLDATAARAVIDAELDRRAHPLPGNLWKLDAAAGLLQHAVDQLTGTGR